MQKYEAINQTKDHINENDEQEPKKKKQNTQTTYKGSQFPEKEPSVNLKK